MKITYSLVTRFEDDEDPSEALTSRLDIEVDPVTNEARKAILATNLPPSEMEAVIQSFQVASCALILAVERVRLNDNVETRTSITDMPPNEIAPAVDFSHLTHATARN